MSEPPPVYCVYIVTGVSLSRVLYIGVTSDLQGRIAQHRSRSIPGFTAKYGCDILVFFESFCDVNVAIAREKQLKGWKRAKKVALIETTNPEWRELKPPR